ncbi:MAG: hypothetical protein AB1679_01420 [Actinomycetota bacterium]
MSLPIEAGRHHTLWIDLPGGRTVAVRYVSDGDRLVCFGDDGLAGIPAGSRLFASLRALACGPKVHGFRVRVEDLQPEALSLGLLADLVGDRTLGRTSDEVTRNLEHMRSTRRLVALEA